MSFLSSLPQRYLFGLYALLAFLLGIIWWSISPDSDQLRLRNSFYQTPLTWAIDAASRWRDLEMFKINKPTDAFPTPHNEGLRMRALRINELCEHAKKQIIGLVGPSAQKNDLPFLATIVGNLRDSLAVHAHQDSISAGAIQGLAQTRHDLLALCHLSPPLSEDIILLLRDNTLLQIQLATVHVLASLGNQLNEGQQPKKSYLTGFRPLNGPPHAGQPFQVELSLFPYFDDDDDVSYAIDGKRLEEQNGMAVFFKNFHRPGTYRFKGEVRIQNPLSGEPNVYSKTIPIQIFEP